jgi:hypothetical protein
MQRLQKKQLVGLPSLATKVDDAITKAIATGEGQTVWLNSKGVNKDGVQVSNFNFEWTLKVKS